MKLFLLWLNRERHLTDFEKKKVLWLVDKDVLSRIFFLTMLVDCDIFFVRSLRKE